MECYLRAAQQLRFDTVFAIYFVYSVLAVAKNRQTHVRQMSTYLVCTSGNKFYFQQRKFAKVFKQFVMRFNRNVTRFFVLVSSTMLIYTDGAGKVVNKPSDSKGERSCMNYMHVRIKQ